MITPNGLQIFNANGETTMASTFCLEKRFVLVWVRCHFRRPAATSGTEIADLTIDLDSRYGTDYDTRLWTVQDAGYGYDVNMRIRPDEYQDWTFEAGDKLTFNWANPDTGEINWGLTVALAEAY